MTKTFTVNIQNHTYNPDRSVITVGDSIVWKNNDHMNHTATRDEDPVFNTGTLKPGNISEPVTFASPTSDEGLEYYCKPHPEMKGIIIVNNE